MIKNNSKNKNNIEVIKAIQKKLMGKKLSYHEIFQIMDEIAQKRLDDILITYFVAANFKNGYDPQELYHFTKAMVETGNKLSFDGIVADKHSTGGLAGTRTTLILVPIIAAAGFKIPKISSRAITSPAGTADVMETLAEVDFKKEKLIEIVNSVGGCIAWNGKLGIAPADDLIIKVEEPILFESLDKIIISVMSKKIAIGSNHLVLDIPYGKNIKIKDLTTAKKVANKFKFLASKFKIKLEIDINQAKEPAGFGIGPSLEAKDALLVLEQSQQRPIALEEKALRLAGKLLNICYQTKGEEKDGYKEAKRLLISGQALRKMKEIIKAQKGNDQVTSFDIQEAKYVTYIKAEKTAIIKAINNQNLNILAKILGAPKDKQAGIVLRKKIGQPFSKNETLAVFYSNDDNLLEEALESYRKNLPIFIY